MDKSCKKRKFHAGVLRMKFPFLKRRESIDENSFGN